MKPTSISWTMSSIVVTLGFLSTPVASQSLLPSEPILRIETQMHVGQVRRIGVDARCSLMVTGSDDKTARLWTLPKSGQGEPALSNVMRVPIGDGDDGKILAVALSPDTRFVVAGGRDALADQTRDFGVYVFETATGKIVRRLGKLSDPVADLVFSSGGQYLAATLEHGGGLRVWDTKSWKLIGQDGEYGGKSAYSVAFDGNGRLYTVAWDGFLRRYGRSFRLEAKVATIAGKLPLGVAIHPKRDWVAMGFEDSSAVEIYDTKDLKRLFAADTAGVGHGAFYAVSWSADGARLYAAGSHADAQNNRVVRIWDDAGRGQGHDVGIAQNAILQLLPCGSGIAVGASDPAFGILSPSGERRVWREGTLADMRGTLGEHFTVSDDGSKVRFGLGVAGDRPVLFDVTASRLAYQPQATSGLAPPDTESLKLSDWKNNHAPKLDGKALKPELPETGLSRAVAIAPGSESFVLGAAFLRSYGKDGQVLWEKKTPATAWGVNIPRGGKFVVVAYGDGTIRWHRLADGEEILALFVDASTREWVLWTPHGYYTSSAYGDQYIGWHVNKGWEQAGEFVTAARLKKHLYRPDVVKRAFELADADRAVREVGLSGFRLLDLTTRTPPDFRIVDPADKAHADNSTVAIGLKFAETNDPVTGLDVKVNGKQVTPRDVRDIDQPIKDADTRIINDIPLQKGDNQIQVTARNDVGETVQNLLLYLDRQGPLDQHGRLFILAIGVDKYPKLGPPWTLRYAGADARLMLDTLTEKAGPLHTKVISKLLVSDGETPPTRSNIEDALLMFRDAQPEDTAILYLASHGVNEGPDYLMIPEDAERSDAGDWRPSSVVKWSVLQLALQNALGIRIMFVDTCHAGGAFNPRLIKDAVDANIVVFSATDRDTDAQEREELGHGVFTYALSQGLNGAADRDHRGSIKILALGSYVSDEVERMTNNEQEPAYMLAGVTKDFVVAAP